MIALLWLSIPGAILLAGTILVALYLKNLRKRRDGFEAVNSVKDSVGDWDSDANIPSN